MKGRSGRVFTSACRLHDNTCTMAIARGAQPLSGRGLQTMDTDTEGGGRFKPLLPPLWHESGAPALAQGTEAKGPRRAPLRMLLCNMCCSVPRACPCHLPWPPQSECRKHQHSLEPSRRSFLPLSQTCRHINPIKTALLTVVPSGPASRLQNLTEETLKWACAYDALLLH